MTAIVATAIAIVAVAMLIALAFFTRSLNQSLRTAREELSKAIRTAQSFGSMNTKLVRAAMVNEGEILDWKTVVLLMAERMDDVLRIDKIDPTAARWRLLEPLRSMIPMLSEAQLSQIRAEVLTRLVRREKNAWTNDEPEKDDFIVLIANRDSERVSRQAMTTNDDIEPDEP